MQYACSFFSWFDKFICKNISDAAIIFKHSKMVTSETKTPKVAAAQKPEAQVRKKEGEKKKKNCMKEYEGSGIWTSNLDKKLIAARS